jgi:GTP cyclohydrolase IV
VLRNVKDVHATAPERGGLRLRSVGLSGIRKPLSIRRPDRVHELAATIRVGVDLPADRKGSDLSRNAEILAEVIDRTVQEPAESLESACSSIARELLSRHPSATQATVDAEATYFLRRGVSADRRSFEDFLLRAEARSFRASDGSLRLERSVGAEVVGMTTCPCAMETTRTLLEAQYPMLSDPGLKGMPMITHNQRNRTSLLFAFGEHGEVEADSIIAAIEAAQSSPTFAILKREDEGRVVTDAHRRPKFVEDVLRDLLASLPVRFPEIPDDVRIRASTVSEESIHKYNVEASHETTMGDLRRSHPS